jgi:DNA invertase Pin-like site-specific DNA recombinase
MKINNKYGYVRVSSKSQESNSSIKSQKQQLIQNGIQEQNILVEVGSAANEIKNRPVFQKFMNEKLQENDLLSVTNISKLTEVSCPTILVQGLCLFETQEEKIRPKCNLCATYVPNISIFMYTIFLVNKG